MTPRLRAALENEMSLWPTRTEEGRSIPRADPMRRISVLTEHCQECLPECVCEREKACACVCVCVCVCVYVCKHAIWHWTQWTHFSAWHSGLWCCITTLGFGNKMFCGSEDIIGQTFTSILNLHCDLDLECSNQVFPQDTLAYDAVLPNQVWLQTDQQFRRFNKK